MVIAVAIVSVATELPSRWIAVVRISRARRSSFSIPSRSSFCTAHHEVFVGFALELFKKLLFSLLFGEAGDFRELVACAAPTPPRRAL